MPSEIYRIFRAAILAKQQVACTYDGLYREVCPHIIGHKDGAERALVFQFGGDSSQPLAPGGDWKCFVLAKARDVMAREGVWYTREQHGAQQRCVEEVDLDVNIHVRRPDLRGPVALQTSSVLSRIQALVQSGTVVVSRHGFRELAADDIALDDILAGVAHAKVVEEYLDTGRGPSVLVLTYDSDRRPLHIVWGLPKGREERAVLVTAYRPDPARWSDDWTRRKRL